MLKIYFLFQFLLVLKEVVRGREAICALNMSGTIQKIKLHLSERM